jgi:hypothetical protein
MTGKLLTFPGDFKAFVTVFGKSFELPAGTILFTFGSAAFLITPDYKEAIANNLGEKLEQAIPKRTALEIIHHAKVSAAKAQEALA